jgi:CBS domain-containing protein
VVPPTATPEEARAVMAAEGTDWVAVCAGDRLRGWVGADEIERVATLADAEPRPFVAVVNPDTTLKNALDGIVTSRTRVAVVVEPEDGEVADDSRASRRYLGMLTLDNLAEGVTR